MPTDPKKLESLLNKLATDDDFRKSAASDPHSAYAAHGIKYTAPKGKEGSIPSKKRAQAVVNTLNTPSDKQDPKIFNDKIFADEIFADKIFADEIFADKIFADKIFADEIFKQ